MKQSTAYARFAQIPEDQDPARKLRRMPGPDAQPVCQRGLRQAPGIGGATQGRGGLRPGARPADERSAGENGSGAGGRRGHRPALSLKRSDIACSRCRACEAAYEDAVLAKPAQQECLADRGVWFYDRFAVDRSLAHSAAATVSLWSGARVS
ncbi:hypothetical protein EMIT048CA2_120125 [Pseudomonas chlororaphis]